MAVARRRLLTEEELEAPGVAFPDFELLVGYELADEVFRVDAAAVEDEAVVVRAPDLDAVDLRLLADAAETTPFCAYSTRTNWRMPLSSLALAPP